MNLTFVQRAMLAYNVLRGRTIGLTPDGKPVCTCTSEVYCGLCTASWREDEAYKEAVMRVAYLERKLAWRLSKMQNQHRIDYMMQLFGRTGADEYLKLQANNEDLLG